MDSKGTGCEEVLLRKCCHRSPTKALWCCHPKRLWNAMADKRKMDPPSTPIHQCTKQQGWTVVSRDIFSTQIALIQSSRSQITRLNSRHAQRSTEFSDPAPKSVASGEPRCTLARIKATRPRSSPVRSV